MDLPILASSAVFEQLRAPLIRELDSSWNRAANPLSGHSVPPFLGGDCEQGDRQCRPSMCSFFPLREGNHPNESFSLGIAICSFPFFLGGVNMRRGTQRRFTDLSCWWLSPSLQSGGCCASGLKSGGRCPLDCQNNQANRSRLCQLRQ